jgi:hypothetical protein
MDYSTDPAAPRGAAGPLHCGTAPVDAAPAPFAGRRWRRKFGQAERGAEHLDLRAGSGVARFHMPIR